MLKQPQQQDTHKAIQVLHHSYESHVTKSLAHKSIGANYVIANNFCLHNFYGFFHQHQLWALVWYK